MHEHSPTAGQLATLTNPAGGQHVPSAWCSSGRTGRPSPSGCVARSMIAPHVRFQDQVGEQATLFRFDPCGNALEFRDIGPLFAR